MNLPINQIDSSEQLWCVHKAILFIRLLCSASRFFFCSLLFKTSGWQQSIACNKDWSFCVVSFRRSLSLSFASIILQFSTSCRCWTIVFTLFIISFRLCICHANRLTRLESKVNDRELKQYDFVFLFSSSSLLDSLLSTGFAINFLRFSSTSSIKVAAEQK